MAYISHVNVRNKIINSVVVKNKNKNPATDRFRPRSASKRRRPEGCDTHVTHTCTQARGSVHSSQRETVNVKCSRGSEAFSRRGGRGTGVCALRLRALPRGQAETLLAQGAGSAPPQTSCIERRGARSRRLWCKDGPQPQGNGSRGSGGPASSANAASGSTGRLWLVQMPALPEVLAR